MTDDNEFEDDERLPWADIEAARKNRRLQQKHPVAEGQSLYGANVKPCPQCHAAASQLNWLYFESPAETWEHLCGRAGWMTVCDRCHLQVNFFCDVMN